VKFVDQSNPNNFEKAITSKTKALFAETIGNPKGDILDIEAVANVAYDHSIPLIVDNTFLTSFLFLQGIETLQLRMERHGTNALAVSRFLENHEAIQSVSYTGLESHPSYNLAQKYLPKGQGAIITFEISGWSNTRINSFISGYGSD
jgi:O-acetylhomoserine/O-acetylserine sulfhydrylase-like pyridoxal-dependent enzyme